MDVCHIFGFTSPRLSFFFHSQRQNLFGLISENDDDTLFPPFPPLRIQTHIKEIYRITGRKVSKYRTPLSLKIAIPTYLVKVLL